MMLPRSRWEKNSPMFLANGAQPLACHIPCNANNNPIQKAVRNVPMRAAVTMEAIMPNKTTLRVP